MSCNRPRRHEWWWCNLPAGGKIMRYRLLMKLFTVHYSVRVFPIHSSELPLFSSVGMKKGGLVWKWSLCNITKGPSPQICFTKFNLVLNAFLKGESAGNEVVRNIQARSDSTTPLRGLLTHNTSGGKLCFKNDRSREILGEFHESRSLLFFRNAFLEPPSRSHRGWQKGASFAQSRKACNLPFATPNMACIKWRKLKTTKNKKRLEHFAEKWNRKKKQFRF